MNSSSDSSIVEFAKNTLLNKNNVFNKFFNIIVDYEVKKEIADNFPGLKKNPNNWSRCLSELLEDWNEVVSQDMSDISFSEILEGSIYIEFIKEKTDFFEKMDVDKIAANSVLFKEHFEFNVFKKMFISMKRNEPEKLKELIIENTKKVYRDLIDIFTAIDESGIV